MKHTLAAMLLVTFAGCGVSRTEAPIRDLRPLKVERGEKFVVEANGPLFAVGAPTTLTFDGLIGGDKKPITIAARAVGKDRVLADADENLELLLGNQHVYVATTVTVQQTVDGKVYANKSDAREPFELDLFPHNLQHLANHFAQKVSGGEVEEWLGLKLAAAPGGVKVVALVDQFDPAALIKQYDRVPLDGIITRAEAKAGGMTDEEWARLNPRPGFFRRLFGWNADQLTMAQLESRESERGSAAAAGIQLGDLITTANGKPIVTPSDFEAAWQNAGDQVPVTVTRSTGSATIGLPSAGAPQPFPAWIIWALVLALAAGICAAPVPVIGGLVVVWERKISAYMQSRLGPNRVGPGGWLQWLADGLKLIMKEDIVPTEADPYLFRASPYLAFIGAFLTFVVLPFSHFIIVSDLNIGLLFLLSVTSLVVVSIIMGGWSSNSKWSLLGGMRSAAQIISYELPASVALLTIATLTGSLSTQHIVEAQGGAPWNWYLFRTPFTFAAFFIYFISALAEGNRTPFDLPEAESELVSGYNTEYSGFRFALFPLVEWVNLFIIGAVTTMLFLGGWRIPHVATATMETRWYLDLLGFAIFLAKDIAIIFVIIWIRWTLPRFRVDQMMNLCWKYFIPISFAGFVGVLAWAWLVPHWLDVATRYLMFAVFGLGFGGWFLTRVMYNSRKYTDLVLNDALGKTNA
ncbi:MAG TPA: NADH-quinone oxidoreductase subunit NuoH [Polyangia bacterium]|nr:NADH-quinone oxidoreductase subunit NuoH [Polyangia bacterium]